MFPDYVDDERSNKQEKPQMMLNVKCGECSGQLHLGYIAITQELRPEVGKR